MVLQPNQPTDAVWRVTFPNTGMIEYFWTQASASRRIAMFPTLKFAVPVQVARPVAPDGTPASIMEA